MYTLPAYSHISIEEKKRERKNKSFDSRNAPRSFRRLVERLECVSKNLNLDPCARARAYTHAAQRFVPLARRPLTWRARARTHAGTHPWRWWSASASARGTAGLRGTHLRTIEADRSFAVRGAHRYHDDRCQCHALIADSRSTVRRVECVETNLLTEKKGRR